MTVQLRAIEKKDEKITIELIRKTAKQDFGIIQPMIVALRNNDLEALSRFEDVRPPNIENLIQQYILDLSKKEEVILHRKMLRDLKKQEIKPLQQELTYSLIELNYPKTRTKAAVKYVLKEEKELEFEEYLELAKKYLEETSPKKKKNQKFTEDDLRSNLLSSYEGIKKKGFITSSLSNDIETDMNDT